jgi:hypothetical protein
MHTLAQCFRAVARGGMSGEIIVENELLSAALLERLGREAQDQHHVRSLIQLLSLLLGKLRHAALDDPVSNGPVVAFALNYEGSYLTLLRHRKFCVPSYSMEAGPGGDISDNARLFFVRCVIDGEDLDGTTDECKDRWAQLCVDLQYRADAPADAMNDILRTFIRVFKANNVDFSMLTLVQHKRTPEDADALARYIVVAMREAYALLERLVRPERQRRLLLRRLLGEFALGMRALRRNKSIRRHRSMWREAETAVAAAITSAVPQRVDHDLLRNRLDLLTAYYPHDAAARKAYIASVPEELSGVLYFYAWASRALSLSPSPSV